jgi:uncharacterized protein (DUF1684 family)
MSIVRRPLIAVVALVAAAGCTSGPAPVDLRPYEQQIERVRLDKDASFRADPNSPIPDAGRAAFKGLAYYPIDAKYHVPARLVEERSGPPHIIQMQTSKNQREPYRRIGTLKFAIGADTYSLTAFANANLDNLNRLFVPFGDLTNGTETYEGGRFLDLNRTATGLYDLDFNLAYHPYCLYNYEWECPVPPRENRLLVAIRAGERLDKGSAGSRPPAGSD